MSEDVNYFGPDHNAIVKPFGLFRDAGVFRIKYWMPNGDVLGVTLTEERPAPFQMSVALRALADSIESADDLRDHG